MTPAAATQHNRGSCYVHTNGKVMYLDRAGPRLCSKRGINQREYGALQQCGRTSVSVPDDRPRCQVHSLYPTSFMWGVDLLRTTTITQVRDGSREYTHPVSCGRSSFRQAPLKGSGCTVADTSSLCVAHTSSDISWHHEYVLPLARFLACAAM